MSATVLLVTLQLQPITYGYFWPGGQGQTGVQVSKTATLARPAIEAL